MKDRTLQIDLWRAINEYAEACGGDTSSHTSPHNGRRMNAVVEIERLVFGPPGEAPREVVRAFASAMERELRQNDHKAGWENDSVQWLLARLCEEVAELVHVFDVEPTSPPERVGPREAFAIAEHHLLAAAGVLERTTGTIWTRGAARIAPPTTLQGGSTPLSEAADVANFAMMVADVAKRLPFAKLRKRRRDREGAPTKGKDRGTMT